MRISNSRGFTLIEIMIVIAILGLLAAIMIPSFITYRNKTYCSQVEVDAQNVLTALSAYFSETGNSSCGSVDRLLEQEGLALSGNNIASLNEDQSTTPISYTVSVKDGSRRCPKGLYFIAGMGSTVRGRWSK